MHMRFLYRLISFLMVLLLIAVLGGCGQTGDLFLAPENDEEEEEESDDEF
jgi:predicted small lipoprotein YifL